MAVDDKDDDSWDMYGKYRNFANEKNNKPPKNSLSDIDEEEFSLMKNSENKNESISSAYNLIMQTFSKDKITKKDIKPCLESMRNAYNYGDKPEKLQMLYWASRCYELIDKKAEEKNKKATNNFQTYKRFELFAQIRENSDNENFYHLNRCVEDISKLNITFELKLSFVDRSMKFCNNDNFINNCKNKTKELQLAREKESVASAKKFNNNQILKRESLYR